MKSIGMTYLTHIDLGNHNAGEGGSQLSDLKTYENKPYISGQAYRHAIKDALKSITDDLDTVDCTPQHACGEISDCKLCDLFGYMNTDLGGGSDNEPQPKRVSPLRATPFVGQYEMPVTTDMITQYAVGGSVKKEDGEESATGDNRIGYREMTENVFKGGVAIDVKAIGRREKEEVDPDANYDEQYSREMVDELDDAERKKRIKELIDAIQNTTQLAGQARHMADFMPDLLIASSQPTYNQRVTNAIHIDKETGELSTEAMESVLRDLVNMGSEVWVAGTHNPDVINNWDEVMSTAEEIDGVSVVGSVTECYDEIKQQADEL
jgi:CRISPR-associated protein Cas7/Cst2/DevR subtype I-B